LPLFQLVMPDTIFRAWVAQSVTKHVMVMP
jgi:hypothetical protein